MSKAGTERTVLELLNKSASYLAAKGSSSPRLDAELLLSDVLGCSRIQLYVGFERPLEESEIDAYRQSVMRRGKREPVAYIRGHKEFMGRDFKVAQGTLVPRPETELMAEAGIKALEGVAAPYLAELCCGTGAPGISAALECPGSRLLLSDVSEAALEVARRNISLYELDARAEALLSDLFGSWPCRLEGGFDLIMANPPYIKTADVEALEPEISVHEPRIALDGGSEGLDFYGRIAEGALKWLKPGGAIVLEMGAGQAESVCGLLKKAGYGGISVRKDLLGIDRVAEARC